ncbi:hypothetical protein [Embleya sp. NPDC005971]|uniref:hypothetical protein n=1 Tax=Embleya sp. NPDC005971 TaxID=3156724 RepID=UPI0034010E30
MTAAVVVGSITTYILVAICVARFRYRRELASGIYPYALDDALAFGFFWPITVTVSVLFWLPRVARKVVSHGIEPKSDA